MAIDTKTVRHIANLARLRVGEDELAGFAQELTGILAWIEQLNAVDTSGIEPMSGVLARDLPQRADSVTDGGDPAAILANAPEAAQGFFVVPKVVE